MDGILVSSLQSHMEKFVNLIVKKLKDANLFASQGGPIILAQVRSLIIIQNCCFSLLNLSIWPDD